MNVNGKVVVVTGGASGIGLGMARRFVQEGATVVISDINEGALQERAREIGAEAIVANVAKEEDVKNLIDRTIEKHGRIDLFCSNAGITVGGPFGGGPETPDHKWEKIMNVNVMSHVYAARHVVPHMLERGEGYLLNTASAAGLLTEVMSAPYAVTKHAALAFAEWLSVAYHKQGIRVSCLCPEGVRTPMTEWGDGKGAEWLLDTAVTVDQVVDAVMAGLESEQFLILSHPHTLEFFQGKANNYERWLGGSRKIRARALERMREQFPEGRPDRYTPDAKAAEGEGA